MYLVCDLSTATCEIRIYTCIALPQQIVATVSFVCKKSNAHLFLF